MRLRTRNPMTCEKLLFWNLNKESNRYEACSA